MLNTVAYRHFSTALFADSISSSFFKLTNTISNVIEPEFEPFAQLSLENVDLDVPDEEEEVFTAEDAPEHSAIAYKAGPLVAVGRTYTPGLSPARRRLYKALSLTPIVGFFFDRFLYDQDDNEGWLKLGNSQWGKGTELGINVGLVSAWIPQFVAQIMEAYFMNDVATLRECCADGALSILLQGLKEQRDKHLSVQGRTYRIGTTDLARVGGDDRPTLTVNFTLSHFFRVNDPRGHCLHGSKKGRDYTYTATISPEKGQWVDLTEGDAKEEVRWMLTDIHAETVDYVANKEE
ncbi:Tim44 [Carpediemonas membranifera]|uniref:Tim44 n=1 Tax=Carpediemonas membranifera TaxID=201153 RepID=A0A8J6B3Y1_9EUKA|nr:Tim44 [Carpediemonas membranifera]|eukprot:KAG9393799.1 Tim44 [Carpediemonas membranifera]